jgi:hypothetical protein
VSRLPNLPKWTPTSEVSWPRKLRRGFGALLLVSAGAMAVSAMTASSDWGLTQENTG